jgi:hypothetical protein
MANIELTPTELIVHVQGLDRILAFRSQLAIPLAHVVGATIDPSVVREWGNWWKGVRVLGTHVPGIMTLGNFFEHGHWVFWDVHDPAKAITIDLTHERYAKLVIEVADPASAVTSINQATGAHH